MIRCFYQKKSNLLHIKQTQLRILSSSCGKLWRGAVGHLQDLSDICLHCGQEILLQQKYFVGSFLPFIRVQTVVMECIGHW